MEENLLNLYNKINLNNNNILLCVTNDLPLIINESKDNIITKKLIKMNNLLNENKNHFDLLRNEIKKNI